MDPALGRLARPLRYPEAEAQARPASSTLRRTGFAVAAALLSLLSGERPRAGTLEAARYTAALHVLAQELSDLPAVGARLSSGLPSRPLEETGPAIWAAAREIEAQAARDGSSVARGALATVEMLRGDAPAAVELLEDALAESPGDLRLAVDLSAAYLERGRTGGEPYDVVRAVEVAGRARERRAAPAAAFNLASGLTRLGLTWQAVHAWRAYLSADSAGPWATVARLELATLERTLREQVVPQDFSSLARAGSEQQLLALVARHPQGAREWLLESELGAWGADVLAGRDDTAAARLARAKRAAEVLAARAVDRTARDVILLVDGSHGSAERRRALARSLDSYTRGRRLLLASRVEDALPLLRASRDTSAAAGSSLALWADLWIASSEFHRSRFASAALSLDSLRQRVDGSRYPVLLGFAEWLSGAALARQGLGSEALPHYQAAVTALERARERENLAGAEALVAETLDGLGDPRAAWRHRLRALSLTASRPSSIRRPEILRAAVASTLARGDSWAAWHLLSESVETAGRLDARQPLAAALVERARVLASLGRPVEAVADLRRARVVAGALGEAVREHIVADSLVVEAQAVGPLDPARALERLSRAESYYRRHAQDVNVAAVLETRAEQWIRAGEVGAAERDLREGLSLAARAAGSGTRWETLDRRRRVEALFDRMIHLQAAHRRDPDAALRYLERARGYEGVRRAPGVAWIELQSTPDRLLVWLTFGEERGFWMLPVGRGALAEGVARLRRQLQRGAAATATAPALEELSALLVRPWISRVPSRTPIVFVPDELLFPVPFAALLDGDGAHLVENHEVSLALGPGGATDPFHRRRQADPRARRAGALVVAAPAPDAAERADLPSLAGATREAAAIASLYPDATLLSDREATPERFLAAIEGRRVLHYAGHSRADDVDAGGSVLLLSPVGSRSGEVSIDALASRDLDDLELVVLGSCGSLASSVASERGSSAVGGLARPFLEAGARAVVGTFGDLDDEAAAQLLPRFHRRFLATGSASRALREAQLEMLRDPAGRPRPPGDWAAMSVIVNFRGAMSEGEASQETSEEKGVSAWPRSISR